MKEKSEAEMLNRMAAYCSATERCTSDVRKKIENGGLSKEAADRIIDWLKNERFIDESRYARFFVNDKLRFNKWGRVKISYELYKKGISSNVRDEAIGLIDEKEYRSTLMDLLKSKRKTTKGRDQKDISNKLLRFAAGRGFESGITILCLKGLFDDIDEEDYHEDL